MRSRLLTLLMGVLCLLASAGSALAQQSTGQIFGKVTDESGAILPGVTVTLTGAGLLQPQTATTSNTGTYQFPSLVVGTYSVKFQMDGFKTVVHEGVQITVGFNAQVNGTLGVSTVEETVTVSGEAPVVDTRKTSSTASFTREVLESIPTSRDPWVMMEQTPSIVMDRANVGGSQSGQQSGFVVRGMGTGNNVWSLDGVNVTDMSAVGATTMYYNFDNFEEMQYTLGGNDVTIATSGMGVNLVTKSGSDKVRGTGRYLITDNKLQDDNIDDALRGQGASAGNPIQRNEEYGVEAGGPVLKGRAWFWGSVSKSDVNVGVNGFYKTQAGCPTNRTEARALSTSELRECLQTDNTALKNYSFKGTARTFSGNRIEWFSDYADKRRNARDASAFRPPETVVVQSGPVWTHKVNDQQVFSDRWLAEFQYAFVGGGFALDFPNPAEQFGVQRYFDEVTQNYRRSFSQSLFDRPLYLFDTKSTYFLPGFLGGNHSIKFGYSFRNAPVTSYGHTGGYVEARFRNGVPESADLFRDNATEYLQTTHSFYVQDEYQAGRFTARLGLRYDRYDDVSKASKVDANPIIPDRLPAVTFGGADSGVVWSNLSPRVGLNYDVFGTGKTVAGVTVSRYYGQPGVAALEATLNPVTAVSLRYKWNDLNRDELVTANELDFSSLLNQTGNYNPANPGSPTTINRVDPDVKNETTDEVIIGFQHELLPGVALSANYIWRKYDNFRWTTRDGITSDNYVPVTTTPTGCFASAGVAGPCPEITYYQPTLNIAGRAQTLTNRPDYYRNYNGFEVSLTKRYSARWYANVSYAFNSAIDHYDSPRSYGSITPNTDPTNIDKLNGYQWAAESGGSGVSDVWVNAKWVARATAMYSLPWNINVSGFLNGHQGYIVPYGFTTPARANGAGTVTVVLQPYGESRLPNFWQLDMKVEKPIQLGRVRLRPQATLFNLTNSNVVLGRQRTVNSATYNDVLQVLGPRVVQVGLRVDF